MYSNLIVPVAPQARGIPVVSIASSPHPIPSTAPYTPLVPPPTVFQSVPVPVPMPVALPMFGASSSALLGAQTASIPVALPVPAAPPVSLPPPQSQPSSLSHIQIPLGVSLVTLPVSSLATTQAPQPPPVVSSQLLVAPVVAEPSADVLVEKVPSASEVAPEAAVQHLQLLPPPVDYSFWVCPASSVLPPPPTTRVGCLGLMAVPKALKPLAEMNVAAEAAAAMAAVPSPLGPDFVVFGGARYSSTHLTRPLISVPVKKKENIKAAEMECRRAQFLADQLEIAKNYLKIECAAQSPRTKHHSCCTEEVQGSSSSPRASAETTRLEVSKTNIWSIAYGGTPRQLLAALDKYANADVIDSVGYVHYGRRQWGLKRTGDSFTLGLGSKGTPLQFAALAGKLDNVLLLLARGAFDVESPTLKDILSAEAFMQVLAIRKPMMGKRRKLKPAEGEQHAQLSAITVPSVTDEPPLPTLYASEEESCRVVVAAVAPTLPVLGAGPIPIPVPMPVAVSTAPAPVPIGGHSSVFGI